MKNYIEIKNDNLVFAFKELGEREEMQISFQRTLRIPDNNKKHSLPPGLGSFPLLHVEDYAEKLPESWTERSGVFSPMYQDDAMWMQFRSATGRPYAVKVASGKVNAVSGEPWDNQLHGNTPVAEGIERGLKESKPDYIVCPNQPWLDGFNVGKGVIRQFVAVPLDSGYTVEEQVTGKAEHGGIQIIVYPMKEEMWQKIKPQEKNRGITTLSASSTGGIMKFSALRSAKSVDMGMGAGGMMKQEIYEDKYGLDAWDMSNSLRVFVHLANSIQYQDITGKKPPTEPVTPAKYKHYNYPWFDYYSDDKALEGSFILAKVDSIGSMQTKKNEKILPDEGVKPTYPPIVLGKKTVKDSPKW